MEIPEVLKSYRRIAVVGCSRDEAKYSNKVARFMKEAGYSIIPINPAGGEMLGERAYTDIDSVDVGFDIADVFRPGDEALGITVKAAAKGAKVVWLQEGIVNNEAMRYAEARGVIFIQDRCIMKEYVRHFG